MNKVIPNEINDFITVLPYSTNDNYVFKLTNVQDLSTQSINISNISENKNRYSLFSIFFKTYDFIPEDEITAPELIVKCCNYIFEIKDEENNIVKNGMLKVFCNEINNSEYIETIENKTYER